MLNIVPVLVSVGLHLFSVFNTTQSVKIVSICLDNHLLSIFSVHRVFTSNVFSDISTLLSSGFLESLKW